MIRSYNSIQLTGAIGKDAKVTKVNDASVAQFRVATDHNYKDRNGDWQTETTWIGVCAWEGYGVCDHSLLKKGTKVHVTGRLRTRKYTDKNGVEKEITEVFANTVDVLVDKPGKGSEGTQRNMTGGQSYEEKEDLPF